MKIASRICVALLFGLAGMGCGPSEKPIVSDANVKGTVQLNGKPIGPLGIEFHSPFLGFVTRAESDSSGIFQLEEKIPSGEYRLCLVRPATGNAPSGIPAIYFNDTGTDQVFQLQVGDNDIVMKLKK